MGVILASARLYFWPLILANVLASAIVVDHQLYDAICLSLSLSFLSSFGLLINDLWDRHIDRINGIDRFASAGLLVVPSAVAVAMMSLLLGLYSAWVVSLSAFRLAILIGAALIAYSTVLRRYLLIPTLVTAVVATSPVWAPLILWSSSTDSTLQWYIMSLILLMSSREIMMDIRDIAGDRAGTRDTIPVIFSPYIGRTVALLLSTTGCSLLGLVVVSQLKLLTVTASAGCLVLSGLITYLFLWLALQVSPEHHGNRQHFSQFVILSRAGMLATPPLTLLLWYSH